jgi:uncharacterized protein YbcV (DUF1398 family)
MENVNQNRYEEVLRKHLVFLCEYIRYDNIRIYLASILTRNDDEIIQSKVTNQEKMMTLMDRLHFRGPTAFAAFVDALKQDQTIEEFVAALEVELNKD